ncbi:MAG: immune inhibitor A [Bacteroidales bacterium]|nr:immune inhibitor A [Bacteroidales bacterium]
MKNCRFVVFMILLIFGITGVYSQNTVFDKVKITIKEPADIQQISELGIPLDGTYIKKNEYIVGEFSRQDIEKIKAKGYSVEVLVADMASYYEKRNKQTADSLGLKKKAIENASCFVDKYPTPHYFTLGSVGGYYSYNEIMAQLDSLHQRFPQLVSVKQALSPNSIEGRKLWYVKISDNPSVEESEPKVLYSGLTHAREPMGMQQLFYYMYYLLENYQTNPSVKYLVDNLEMYFLPCTNPDGYALNESTNPNGGGMHRKNCRPTGASNYGIDLNRNFGYMWGYDNVGSSTNIESETYRGTAAFSEPETQALKAFAEAKQFTYVIDYHCYSNVLLYPWGYTNATTPDNNIFRAYSDLMTQMNGFFYGTPMEGVGYNANGGSFDWYYGEQSSKPKILAWSPEAGNANDGFYPASNRIEYIAKTFMEMNLYIARFALKYADIKDLSNRFIVNGNYVRFLLYNVGMNTPTDFTLTFIPVSNGLQATTLQKNYVQLSFLQQFNDSFQINIDASIPDGTLLKYLYKVETSQGFYYTDTFSFVKGVPVTLLTENCSSMTQWTSTTWNTTSSQYHSAPKSITDSPSGDYPDNTTRTITLNQAISLSNAVYAELSFWTKWDIEPLADYVQVQISTDNGTTWQPLCGQYMQPSFLTSTINQPIYDGMRDEWVQERIILNDYLGQNIKIRIKLISGNSYTMQNDGFYFDDMLVQVISSPSNVNINELNDTFNIYPNPAKDNVTIQYRVKNDAELVVTSILGQEIKKIKLDATKTSFFLSIEGLKGLYLFTIKSKDEMLKPQWIMVE